MSSLLDVDPLVPPMHLITQNKYPLGHPISANIMQGGNFADYLIVTAKGGDGGNGNASFERGMRQSRGRPNGGNGGGGGSVIFRPDASHTSLSHLCKLMKAEDGGRGSSSNQHGRRGADLIIPIPLGTDIRELEVIEPEPDIYREDYADAQEPRPRPASKLSPFNFDSSTTAAVVVAQGGSGGLGNISTRRNNHEVIPPTTGVLRRLELNLKTMADVGLVGLPNAGKSSFLAAVTRAHPKIASYPFTTLNPFVGTIEYGDGSEHITIADIPGLIEGAHLNIGLGHAFLKHIVKSRHLVIIVDFSKPDPWLDFVIVQRELDMYQPGLSLRCCLVLANKIDLIADWDGVIARFRATCPLAPAIIPISAQKHTNIISATAFLRKLLPKNKRAPT